MGNIHATQGSQLGSERYGSPGHQQPYLHANIINISKKRIDFLKHMAAAYLLR